MSSQSAANTVRVGLIGYGIGKVYAAALLNAPLYYPGLPPVELAAVCAASEASGRQALEHFHFRYHTTDYRRVMEDPEINAVVIASPNYLHCEMAVAGLRAGKVPYVDKPLANDLTEARQVIRAARQAGMEGRMSFVMRYCPALQHAHKLIREGRLGEIHAFRASYFRGSYQDPKRSLRWKAEIAKSGGGVLADYAPHIVDLVNWLVGTPSRVCAQARIFVPERPQSQGSEQMARVETDDHLLIQAEMPGGAIGTFEAGRLTVGPVNDMRLEIYGSEGSLRWSVEDLNSLYFSEKRMPQEERGWLRIPTMQRYPEAIIPGADLQVGFMRLHIGSLADFVARVAARHAGYDENSPDLQAGLRAQKVLEAAAISVREDKWIDVPNE